MVALTLAEGDAEEWLRARRERAETARVKETVAGAIEAYDKTLTQAHLAKRAALLEGMASKEQIERVRAYISYNVLEKAQTLDTRLVELDIVKITVAQKGRSAIAKANEEWTYFYLEKDTRKRVSKPERGRYRSTYKLVKSGERWLVDEIEIVE